MSAPVLLVTGTDTEVGKTVATAAISAALTSQGMRVAVIKPTQTGLQPGDLGDVDEVARLLGLEQAPPTGDISESQPVSHGGSLRTYEFVRLPDPLAPAAAARRADLPLPSVTEHAARIIRIAERDDVDTVIVEGAGGLLVHLDSEGGTLADLGTALTQQGVRAGFVLVVSPRLGTLNVTALTAEALRHRNLDLVGYVVGSYPDKPVLAEQTNIEDLPEAAGTGSLGTLPEGAALLSAPEFCRQATTWVNL